MHNKEYYYDKNQGDMILLATLDERGIVIINILTCTKEELLGFLSPKHIPLPENIEKYVDNFCISRQIKKTYVDTSMISMLIRLSKDCLNITKTNIIERSAIMEDNGFTDRVNFLITQHPLTYVPETRMTIGIFTHAYINADSITVDIPRSVNIIKQNLSAYGCTTISSIKIGWNAINTSIGSLVRFPCTKKRYLQRSERLKKQKSLFHSEEGTCRQFKGSKPFLRKTYSGGTIVFVMVKDGQFKCLDLFNCTERGFMSFFSITSSEQLEQLEQIDINSIQTSGRIYTDHIFALIRIARDKLNIDEVRIYDKSCNNVVAGEGQKNQAGFLTDFDPTANVRFGGIKTKCKRRKTRRLF